MNYSPDTIISYIAGLCGGGVVFILQIMNDLTFYQKLLQAGFTAFVCGLCGVAGKYAFNKGKDWWYKRKQKRTK
jgi:hypothetical protein